MCIRDSIQRVVQLQLQLGRRGVLAAQLCPPITRALLRPGLLCAGLVWRRVPRRGRVARSRLPFAALHDGRLDLHARDRGGRGDEREACGRRGNVQSRTASAAGRGRRGRRGAGWPRARLNLWSQQTVVPR